MQNGKVNTSAIWHTIYQLVNTSAIWHTIYQLVNTSAVWHTIYQLVNTSAVWHTIYQPSCSCSTKLILWNVLAKSQEKGPLAEKRQDRKSKRTRLKNKRGDRKGESNDSPEIPNRKKKSPASLIFAVKCCLFSA